MKRMNFGILRGAYDQKYELTVPTTAADRRKAVPAILAVQTTTHAHVPAGVECATVESDAKSYRESFEGHAQFVFSHVQHHWHHEKDGVRVPHP